LIRVFAALLAALAPAHAQDGITVTTTYDSYELEADTLPELQTEMNLEGPFGFPAYTTWRVEWTAECQITVTATITLPALGPEADLSPEDAATFHSMLENLEEHEENHIDFALGFARDVQEMDCRGDTASVLQEWLAEERQYDIDTEHGRTEGAWLIDD
jgi:predicted secreted Zn-dependent protease